MLELPHTIIGAVIGTKVDNPFIAFPLAFLSHFLLDMLPHWNSHLNTEMKTHGQLTIKTRWFVVLDVLISFIVGSLLALRFYPDIKKVATIYICCLLSVSADLIEAPYFFFKIKNQVLQRWMNVHKKFQFNVNIIPGIISQIIITIICIWVIFSK